MAATAEKKWNGWMVIHRENGPFGIQTLGERDRWRTEGVLSVMTQGLLTEAHKSTSLRILDFPFKQEWSYRGQYGSAQHQYPPLLATQCPWLPGKSLLEYYTSGQD
jgi:hypothetical protein